MGANELFKSGKLTEAIAALGVEVRDNPTDVQRRTFLFELLCFQGEYDRAEKHLHLLAGDAPDKQMGAVLYFSALHAERVRRDLFAKKEFPPAAVSEEPRGGTVNGQPFEFFEDADPRVGPRLEVFAAGACMWIPFEHIESIEMRAPKRLRDLLWIPAFVQTGPAFQGTELGEVLFPVLAPFSYQHPDGNVRLGRGTEWLDVDGQQVPFGQRMFSADGEDLPILEIRKVEFTPAAAPENAEEGAADAEEA